MYTNTVLSYWYNEYLTVTPYYKSKLRGLYNTAMQDAEGEAEWVLLTLMLQLT